MVVGCLVEQLFIVYYVWGLGDCQEDLGFWRKVVFGIVEGKENHQFICEVDWWGELFNYSILVGMV